MRRLDILRQRPKPHRVHHNPIMGNGHSLRPLVLATISTLPTNVPFGVKRTSREQHEMAAKVPPCRIRNESLLPTLTPRGQAIFVPERLWQNDQRSCGSLSLR
jgi:hypothetical protein